MECKPLNKYDPLIGCDGKPHSDLVIKSLLEWSIKKEAYELSQIYHNEIENRNGKNQSI